MTQGPFFNLFIQLLRDAFDAEQQLSTQLPKYTSSSNNEELKAELVQEVEQNKSQLARLKDTFKQLNENPTGVICQTLKALFTEGESLIKSTLSPSLKDVSLIIFFQKIAHYQIATYGSLRTLAQHLQHSNLYSSIPFPEIIAILQDILDEKSATDERLTDLAEGGFFSVGLNEAAEQLEKAASKNK